MKNNNNEFKDIDFDRPNVKDSGSSIAPPPAKNILIFVVTAIVSIYLIYNFVFADSEKDASKENNNDSKQSTESVDLSKADTLDSFDEPIISIAPPIPDLPSLPDTAINNQLPELPKPSSPELPPSSVLPPVPGSGFGLTPPIPPVPVDGSTSNKSIEDRKKSGMIISGGGGADNKGSVGEAVFGANGDFVLKASSADSARATRIAHDLSALIAQGKLIDAVLETAINTDHQGALRAIISHDVYAEQGNNVLIPKGSRLIGSYLADVQRGQERVYIIWNRVIRPDGIDIAIQSPGSDDLGRSGIRGTVDNKYFEMIANSILLSTVSTAFVALSNKITGSSGSTSTTSNSDGSSTKSGASLDVSTQQGVDNISQVTKKIAENYLGSKPTISVPQGTKLKVFVNKDLMFPKSVANQVRVLQ